MAIEGVFYVRIHASDLKRTKSFYGEALGWRLDTAEPEVAGFWFGSGYLVAARDTRPQGEQSHAGGMHVTVKVTDIDAEHARLVAHGVAVSAIENRPWRTRDFRFTDPDGYVWEYAQAAS